MSASEIWSRPTQKSGLNSPESYIVGRCNHVYLRVLGEDPAWNIMTATADEDDGKIKVFPDRVRLVKAAFKLGYRYKTKPVSREDRAGREYVLICSLTRGQGDTDEKLTADLEKLAKEFFDILDSDPQAGNQGSNEMVDIYQSLTEGDDDEDIYLSDGVWLSSDGSVVDRGR